MNEPLKRKVITMALHISTQNSNPSNKDAIDEFYANSISQAILDSLATIMRERGDKVGSQDWSGSDDLLPSKVFTLEERDTLHQMYEQHNSQMRDYEKGEDFIDDEMMLCYTLEQAILSLKKHYPQ